MVKPTFQGVLISDDIPIHEYLTIEVHTILSFAWKKYHQFYTKKITSKVGLETYLHLHVRKELMLNEAQRTM